MTPVNPTLVIGLTQQLTAIETYVDGTHEEANDEVTWTSSNAAVATVSSGGLATAVSPGDTVITAVTAGAASVQAKANLSIVNPGGGFTWQNLPTGVNSLSGAAFPDAVNGWIAAEGGNILHTGNSGTTWSVQESGKTCDFYGVSFVDAHKGWITGAGGTILATTDGGAHWQAYAAITSNMLYTVNFPTAQVGWIVGSGGTILHTITGGK